MDSITITKEQFKDVLIEANKQFAESGKTPNDANDEMVRFMMALQNIAFGSLIMNIMFSKKEDN